MPPRPECNPEFTTAARIATYTMVAVGILASLETAGCSSPHHQSENIVGTQQPSPDAGLTNACELAPSGDQAHVVAAQERCADALAHGSISLVLYPGVSGTVVQKMTADMERAMKQATGGILDLPVNAIPASAAAKAELEKRVGPNKCIDTTNADDFASTAASDTMSGLGKDTFVIAVTSLANDPPCNPNLSGVADTAHGNADVYFDPNLTPDDIDSEADQVASVAVHEEGHLVFFGHAGTIMSNAEYGTVADTLTTGTTFDLGGFLTNSTLSTYQEYNSDSDRGDSYIEGEPNSTQFVAVNALDLNQLALIRGKKPLAQMVSANELTLTPADAKANRFAVVTLPAPVTLQDPDTKAATEGQAGKNTFDALAVEPLVRTTAGHAIVDSARLVIFDNTGPLDTNADLGILSTTSPNGGQWTLRDGSELITVRLKNGNLEVLESNK